MEGCSGAVWQASGHQAKLSHCDLDLPASGTALSKPVLEDSLLSYESYAPSSVQGLVSDKSRWGILDL